MSFWVEVTSEVDLDSLCLEDGAYAPHGHVKSGGAGKEPIVMSILVYWAYS